jgi:hypothetical protein
MRYRRIVFFLLGTWIGVSAMLAFAVYLDFVTVDAILKAPPELGHKLFSQTGPDTTRALLRYAASAENVSRFTAWEYAQFALGIWIAATLFVGASTRIVAVVPLTMTLLVAFLHFQITPELAWLSRAVEFIPWTHDALARGQFWKLHKVYEVVEIVKVTLGLGLAAFLYVRMDYRRSRRRRQANEEEMLADLRRDGAIR